MRAASFAVAAKQGVLTGVDIYQGNGMIFSQVFQERRQFIELRSFARIDEEGGAGKIALTGGVQFGKNRNQLDRKIVHAIKADVFKGSEDGALPGAGEPGEDHKLASFLSCVSFHVGEV